MEERAFDFFNMEGDLGEDERLVRDTARRFVEKEVKPDIADHWEAGHFPRELVPKMGALGFLGPFVPAEYGGAGVSYTVYGLICLELEMGDSGVRSFSSVQSSLVMYPLWKFGSEEQKRTYLPRLASGESVGCFGLTEAEAGSDPGSMKTRARREGDGWRLNGSKMWITNGSIADLAIVWARDEEDRVRGFIVHHDDPGFSARDIPHKMSLRASVTSELAIEDVRIPAHRELPHTAGLKSPLMCLTSARYGIAWGAVGAATACFLEALAYTRDRVQFDRPLASFQLCQEKLVDMATDITQARLLALQLGRLADRGEMTYAHVSMAKRRNVAVARDAALAARALLGANGITLDFQAMRHLCNMETLYTYEGTHDIHTLILGEKITGISAFR